MRIPILGANFIAHADTVIVAIGYGGPLIPSKTPGSKTMKPGILRLNPKWLGAPPRGPFTQQAMMCAALICLWPPLRWGEKRHRQGTVIWGCCH